MSINDKWVLIKNSSDWKDYKEGVKKLVGESKRLLEQIENFKPSHRYPFAICSNIGFERSISIHTMPKKTICLLFGQIIELEDQNGK